MNAYRRTPAILAVAAALALTLAAAGVEKNGGTRRITVDETVTMLGTTVKPGSYTLKWFPEKGAQDVRVQLEQGKMVLASGMGRWVAAEHPAHETALVYRTSGSGARELAEILFERSPDSIHIEAPATAQTLGS